MSPFAEYAAHGWHLCALDRGKKGPTYPNWQAKGITVEAAEGVEGAGLIHALSGTAALDIDNLEAATPWLVERGVDLQALLEADNAVQIVSGKPNRAKLLYRMKRPLRTMRPKGSGLELRCQGAQDVLPPSIHPDTRKPYAWGGGLMSDWRTLPPIPATLLAVWRSLTDDDASPALAQPPAAAPAVDLPKLRKALYQHSPDAEYPEWIKLGMQLHDATQGGQEGFDLWAAWSRGIKRKPYPGDVVLKSHWLSFESAPGKHVARGAALEAELPAEPEDFPIEPIAPPAPPGEKEAKRKAALEALIERFVFVVHEQEYFDTERNALIGDKAIRHLLTPFMPKNSGGREVDPIDKLMRAKGKAAVEAMAFHPGEKPIFEHRGKRYANTFFADSVPKPVEPMKDELDKINWLFDRIDDPLFRQWLKQFYAHVVQRPGIKIRSAPLIWSKTQGNGKSTIVGTIPKLLVGEEYYTEVTQGELNSDHNDYLIGKWHVTLSEFRAGTRGEREAISKKVENWIADDVLAIHPKGTKGYSIPNHLVVTASTNKDDAALIDANDRKWAIHMLNVPAMTHEEKQWLFTGFLMTPRAPGVLRHYFMNISLEGFDPNADAPKTKARGDMIGSSMTLDQEMLEAAFEECAEPLSKDVVITREVGDYVRRHSAIKPSNDRIGKLLCSPPINGAAFKWRCGQSVYRGVIIRNHNFWRSSKGSEIMAHIAGEDVNIVVDPLLE